MPLFGTFDTMQLTDLFQWIYTCKRSGTLTVMVELENTYLFFNRGEIAELGSDDPLRLDLGHVLLKEGLIDEAELREALKLTRQGMPLKDVLIEAQVLSEEQIAKVQAEHALEIVLDLFFREEGSFHFSVTLADPSPNTGLLEPPGLEEICILEQAFSTQEILLEGMRRLDEWSKIREVFPSSYVVVHGLEGSSENLAWKELRRADGPLSVGELCLRMRGTRFVVYRDLYEAYEAGLVALDVMSAGWAEAVRQTPVDVLVQNARLLMSEEQYDEAREVLSTANSLDPDNAEVRSLLREIRQTQLAYFYQQLPPHRIPEIVMTQEQLKALKLNPREMYLASRLDGRWDVGTLVVATPLGELETLRILKKFLHAGIARFID